MERVLDIHEILAEAPRHGVTMKLVTTAAFSCGPTFRRQPIFLIELEKTQRRSFGISMRGHYRIGGQFIPVGTRPTPNIPDLLKKYRLSRLNDASLDGT
jgi:hypothetical protein